MQWYDYIFIFIGMLGLILTLFGSYHNAGTRKSGVWGLILVIGTLIARVVLWIIQIIK